MMDAATILKAAGVVVKPSWPLQSHCIAFYGDPRRRDFFEQNLIAFQPPYEMFYDGKPIKKFSVHKKCAESLHRVLSAVWQASGCNIPRNAPGADQFSGSYNLRVIRGGTSLSMHSFGCALDFCAEKNPMTTDCQKGLFTETHPLVVAFKNEGWIWGGDWSGRRDPMHFQAARIK